MTGDFELNPKIKLLQSSHRPRDGVNRLAPHVTLIGKVQVPEVVAHACFGGTKRNLLFGRGTASLCLGVPSGHRGQLNAKLVHTIRPFRH
jgi:hypothetical protein